MPKTNKYFEQIQFIKHDKAYDEHKKNTEFVSAVDKIFKYRDLESLTKKERRSIVLVFDDIKDIVPNYKLQDIFLSRGGSHCDLCGTAINHVFRIVNNYTNKTMNLGSECIINHHIRIDGYNTAEEIANYVEQEKQKLSNLHRDFLWKDSDEYKRDDLARWLLKLVKKYSHRIKFPRDSWRGDKNVSEDIFREYKVDGIWPDLYFINKENESLDIEKSERLVKKIKSEIDAIGFEKTYKIEIPVGKTKSVFADIDIKDFKITPQSVQRLADSKNIKIKYIYEITSAISNTLWKNKDDLNVSGIASYKAKTKLALMNEKNILQFVSDYCSYMLKVKAVFDSHYTEAYAIMNPPKIVETKVEDTTKDPLVSLIESRKTNGNVCGIILNKIYNGYNHQITAASQGKSGAVLIEETNEQNEVKKYWIPKSKIYYDKENGFILIAKWLVTANKIQGII